MLCYFPENDQCVGQGRAVSAWQKLMSLSDMFEEANTLLQTSLFALSQVLMGESIWARIMINNKSLAPGGMI